jgi:hypothetical protein
MTTQNVCAKLAMFMNKMLVRSNVKAGNMLRESGQPHNNVSANQATNGKTKIKPVRKSQMLRWGLALEWVLEWVCLWLLQV